MGARLTVATIDGTPTRVRPGTQPGDVLVCGRGVPVLGGRGRGDHRLLLNVVVPGG